MIINGKETTPQFDLGAFRIVKRMTGIVITQGMKEDDMADVDFLHALLYAIAHRGNPDITEADVDCITPRQLIDMDLQKLLVDAMPDEGTGESEVPLAVKKKKASTSKKQ